MNKRCSGCSVTKPVVEFSKAGRTKDGLHAYCKLCSRASQTAWRSRNVVGVLLGKAKDRCRTTGVRFDLSLADVEVPEFCPILGVKLTYPGMYGSDQRGPRTTSASLDRIIPALGYVRGNVRVISHRANKMKNDGTLEEHERLVAWLRSATSEALASVSPEHLLPTDTAPRSVEPEPIVETVPGTKTQATRQPGLFDALTKAA
jgi:hypothetical protein